MRQAEFHLELPGVPEGTRDYLMMGNRFESLSVAVALKVSTCF